MTRSGDVVHAHIRNRCRGYIALPVGALPVQYICKIWCKMTKLEQLMTVEENCKILAIAAKDDARKADERYDRACKARLDAMEAVEAELKAMRTAIRDAL